MQSADKEPHLRIRYVDNNVDIDHPCKACLKKTKKIIKQAVLAKACVVRLSCVRNKSGGSGGIEREKTQDERCQYFARKI